MKSCSFLSTITLVLMAAVLTAVVQTNAVATPQLSLMTGNKCLNCHITAQGSGIRNELGWYVERDMKLVDPKNVALGWLYALDPESNSFFDGTLTVGIDWRAQFVRSPRAESAQGRIIPMQMAMHAAYQPAQWLTFEGMVDLASIASVFRRISYPGQQTWSASAIIQPSYTLPSLRLGHFQPTIGMRYDDHTMLARVIAGAALTPLIPPNFAEYGAELNYDGLQWLTLTLGAYMPNSLSQMKTTNKAGEQAPLVESLPDTANFATLVRSPSTLARAMVWLRSEDHVVNSYLGASLFGNSTFALANIFAGVGISDRLSLMGEYALSGVRDGRQTRNFSVELTYQPIVGLMPYVRYEQGTTRFSDPSATSGIGEQFATQITGGAQIFPVPYIELRPEVRYFQTEAYTATRFYMQLHLFW